MATSHQRNSLVHFNVSTGLKSVLGNELITDDEVSLFELIKNSFDAEASRVEIYFDSEKIIISDNGYGMSREDIYEKWLVVAYSFKKDEDKNFRNKSSNSKHYAGSKGIGRFSSDRLGEILILETKKESSDVLLRLSINWDLFDDNSQDRFEDVNINYEETNEVFNIPPKLSKNNHGTVLTISNLRKVWDRESLLRLRAALAKLINPFGASADDFEIAFFAPEESKEDQREIERELEKDDAASQNKIVNGVVQNFIFSTLQEKTTFIDVNISENGEFIETCLVDRGEIIYRIREPNIYPFLNNSGFRCQLFYLNQSAKTTFTRRMGIQTIRFGSVFLFRNGFRVFPIGEQGDDWFGMDQRKQQGYNRFLGSREIIGRVDVFGIGGDFKEASSRNTGLISTPAVDQLRKCFRDHCLIRLEKYVVPVNFADSEDSKTSDLSRISTDQGRARVSAAVFKLVDNNKIELLEYNRNLITILDERSGQFEKSIINLRGIANKTNDKNLEKEVDDAEKRFQVLKVAEQIARQQADYERQAKEDAQARAVAAEIAVAQANEQLTEERKRSHFLTSIATLDTETVLNLHHQVTIYAVDIQQQIYNFLSDVSEKSDVAKDTVIDLLERITLLNKKVMSVSKFATKANFRLESEQIEGDLGDYIEEYINGIVKDFLQGPMLVNVVNESGNFVTKFKPIDVSVIIDNLVTNARKARAGSISFRISYPDKKSVYINVEDDGRGLDRSITESNRIFEKGFSKTDGSGLGLYHVQQVLNDLNGTIEISDIPSSRGITFTIRIRK